MKILMIAEKDAANVSLGRIAARFLKQGHEVTVYAMYFDASVLHYFDSDISIYLLSEISDSIVETYDCIFTSVVSLRGIIGAKLLSVRKPIFTQGYLMDDTIQWGGDLCYLPSLKTSVARYDENIIYSKIEIGEPKYDRVSNNEEISNRLLFIDSGHYPFGEPGKKELARTLLKICDEYPDYELWIKPRFLPEDKIITHKNTCHLYRVLEEEANKKVPSNLVMLKKHEDLKELIDSAHTVICMFTSAFVGAYASGKGLIVLDGLPSEDIYDVRKKHFNHTRGLLEEGGALVDYRKVNEVLPHGVKCPDGHLGFFLAEQEDVAGKICEVTEYLYDEFYARGLFPCTVECSYRNIRQHVKADIGMTWEQAISARYINCLAYKALIMISFHVNAILDISMIQDKLNALKNDGILTEDEFFREEKMMPICWGESVVSNRNLMLQDDIDSGILLNVLYRLRKREEIEQFPKKNIGAYHLYRGLVAYDEKDRLLAIVELKQYMNISQDRTYMKEISDMPSERMRAYYRLVECLIDTGSAESEFYWLEMKKYYKLVYSKDNTVSDRDRAHQYAYMKWCESHLKGFRIPRHYPKEGKYIIYGAGVLSKTLLLREKRIRDRICVFVDAYSTRKSIYDIPIVGLERLSEYPGVHTVIVTVLNEYENIKEKIMLMRPDMDVLPLVEFE